MDNEGELDSSWKPHGDLNMYGTWCHMDTDSEKVWEQKWFGKDSSTKGEKGDT